MTYHPSPASTVTSLNTGLSSADGHVAAVATGSLVNG